MLSQNYFEKDKTYSLVWLKSTLGVSVSANWNPTAKKAKDKVTPNKLANNNFRRPILSTKKSPINVQKKFTDATPADIQIAWVLSEKPAMDIIFAE